MENEKLIKEILAKESTQIKVDVIRIMNQMQADRYNDEEKIKRMQKMLTHYFTSKAVQNYPIDTEKKSQENKKYSESVKVAMVEEQAKKRLEEENRILSRKVQTSKIEYERPDSIDDEIMDIAKKYGVYDMTLLQKIINVLKGNTYIKENDEESER